MLHICSLRKCPELCSHLYHVFPASLILALLLGLSVVNHRVNHIITCTSHTAVLESRYQVALKLTSLPITKIPWPKYPFSFNLDLLNCVLKQQPHFMVLILLKTLEKFHTTLRTATPQNIQMSVSCASCLTTQK